MPSLTMWAGSFLSIPLPIEGDASLGDVTLVYIEETGDRPQRGGLACTVGTEKSDDLPVTNLDGEAAKHQHDVVVDDLEIGDFEHRSPLLG